MRRGRTRLSIGVIVAAAFSVLPMATAQAGAGDWDYRGNRDFHSRNSEYWPYGTGAVYSGGGSFKVCVNSASTENEYYSLDEYDAGSNPDEQPAIWVGSGCTVISNLGKYVDGSNNRAEFYVTTTDGSAVSADLWD